MVLHFTSHVKELLKCVPVEKMNSESCDLAASLQPFLHNVRTPFAITAVWRPVQKMRSICSLFMNKISFSRAATVCVDDV